MGSRTPRELTCPLTMSGHVSPWSSSHVPQLETADVFVRARWLRVADGLCVVADGSRLEVFKRDVCSDMPFDCASLVVQSILSLEQLEGGFT